MSKPSNQKILSINEDGQPKKKTRASRLNMKNSKNNMKQKPLAISVFVWVKIFCDRLQEMARIRKDLAYPKRKAPLINKAQYLAVQQRAQMQPGAPPPEPTMENTYRLEPLRGTPKIGLCYRIIKDYVDYIMEKDEEGRMYQKDKPMVQRHMSTVMAEDIRDECRFHGCFPERYRCVVYVVVGQKNRHGVKVATRCLLDDQVDRITDYTYINEGMFVSVSLYALYYC